MNDVELKRRVLKKLADARAMILYENPFYGNLVMHLKLGLAECRTAYTDMTRIVFDPLFADRISLEEVKFVMLHELLHCTLNHCIRGKHYNHYLYNIACDIVVNSNILLSTNQKISKIDGCEIMHLAPDKKEGYNYNAEEVYDMLTKECGDDIDKISKSYTTLDCHDGWGKDPAGPFLGSIWQDRFEKALKSWSDKHVPPVFRKYKEELEQERLDWRELLHDFIQLHYDRYDYTFSPSDRRYSDSDFVMPAFFPQDGEKVENIWFCVDTSGSISYEELSHIMGVIKQALLQLDGLEGMVSFFDTGVSEPEPFYDIESLSRIKPKGGGGTSFEAIFKYMKENMEDNLPTAIIILTDGYARYPKEDEAMGVPVLWLMFNSKYKAPWGKSVEVRNDSINT